jgi:hypothetical protein
VTKRSKIILGMVGSMAAMAMATPASAAMHYYNMTNGDTLTINTTTASGTWIGKAINASFTSSALSTFSGGLSTNFMATLTSLTGTRTEHGRTYTANPVSFNNRAVLDFDAVANGSAVNLWAVWTAECGCTLCDAYEGSVNGYGTSSGGSSTGGTDVPAPAMTLLFGLGALGLAYRARMVKARATIA